MTPANIKAWLADMKAAGLAKTDADCARLLEVSAHTMVAWKTHGVPAANARRTALACKALLHGLETG